MGYLRREKKWTQDDLAQRLGVKKTAVAAMESKNANPSNSSKVRYLRAMQFTVGDFDRAKLALYGPESAELRRPEPGRVAADGEFHGLGPWMAHVREERQLPQSVLAQLAGESLWAWQSFEDGYLGVRTDRLDPIFERLGVTLWDYLEAKGKENREMNQLRREVSDLRAKLGELERLPEQVSRLLAKLEESEKAN